MKHNPLISSKFLLETPWTDGLYMFTAWQKCGIHKTVTNFTSFCSGGFCKITCTSCTAPLPGIFGRLYNVTTVTWDPQKIPRILVSKNIFGCWRWFIIVDPTQNSENIVVSYLHEAGSRGFSRPQLWRLVVPCCTIVVLQRFQGRMSSKKLSLPSQPPIATSKGSSRGWEVFEYFYGKCQRISKKSIYIYKYIFFCTSTLILYGAARLC